MPKDSTDNKDSKEGSEETRKERVDRELIELLNELRVALPGIQVLFAFLLTVAFTGAFKQFSSDQVLTFFVSFMATALASAFLIAPTAIHRLRFREQDKERILNVSNKLAIIGISLLAAAILAVVLLVTDYIYGRAQALIAAGFVAVVIAIFWYAIPLKWRADDGGRNRPER